MTLFYLLIAASGLWLSGRAAAKKSCVLSIAFGLTGVYYLIAVVGSVAP